MTNKNPSGIDGEIQRLKIRLLLTDDPEERGRILSRLASATFCRSKMKEWPGAEILFREGIEIR